MTRSRSRTAVLALVAVFGLSALASASASAALPEFNPSGGESKLKPPIEFTFLGGKATIPVGGIGTVPCNEIEGTGTITGAKSGTAKLKLKGCRNFLGEACSAGPEGVIVMESLPFVLVYTTKEPTKQVAIDFGRNGSTIMSYSCGGGGGKGVMRGRILAPVTPLNTLTKQFTATLSEKEGFETPTKNYNEALTGTEESFPELSWDGGPFQQREATLTCNSLTLHNFKKGKAEPEEKIEA